MTSRMPAAGRSSENHRDDHRGAAARTAGAAGQRGLAGRNAGPEVFLPATFAIEPRLMPRVELAGIPAPTAEHRTGAGHRAATTGSGRTTADLRGAPASAQTGSQLRTASATVPAPPIHETRGAGSATPAPDNGYLPMPHDVLRKAPGGVRSIIATASHGILLGLLAASLASYPAFATGDAGVPATSLIPATRVRIAAAVEVAPLLAKRLKHAAFEQESASRDARAVANWVVDSGDSQGMPFAIVDKKDAKVFIFDANGHLRGAAPALLGMAVGDDAVPASATVPCPPSARGTHDARRPLRGDAGLQPEGQGILWVDYAGAVSMHPVVFAKAAERRLQRLATPTPLDNRISFGCINVPAEFFNLVVRPAFTGTSGIVYVLPETRSAQILFGSYDVAVPAGL